MSCMIPRQKDLFWPRITRTKNEVTIWNHILVQVHVQRIFLEWFWLCWTSSSSHVSIAMFIMYAECSWGIQKALMTHYFTYNSHLKNAVQLFHSYGWNMRKNRTWSSDYFNHDIKDQSIIVQLIYYWKRFWNFLSYRTVIFFSSEQIFPDIHIWKQEPFRSQFKMSPKEVPSLSRINL